MRWIYNRTADGNNVVTPRDVIDLLTKAKQNQQNLLQSNPNGESPWVISGQSIKYGLEELSKRKRTTLLEAEFPHLWKYIEKFISGKTEYTEKGIRNLLGNEWKSIIKDLSSIGFLSIRKSKIETIYKIPFIYCKGLELTQGRAGS